MQNIKILYVLAGLKSSYFWLGIWLFYYLQFTDYAGVGLIETLVFSLAVLTEIPTGALADLVGKRVTIFLAFLFEGVGNLIAALAGDFIMILLSTPFLAVGTSLMSGAYEAMVYDSLKSSGQEKNYNRVIGKISAISLYTFTAVSILGGLLYSFDPTLPYWGVAICYLLGALLSLFLKEPTVDTDIFSWSGYLQQNIHGFRQLFRPGLVTKHLTLLGVAAIGYVLYQALNDILAVEFGYTGMAWSLVGTAVFLLSAWVSGLTGRLTNYIGDNRLYSLAMILLAFTLMAAPYIGLVMGGILFAVRYSAWTLIVNLQSIFLNSVTESRYRATTLSTFNLLAHVPYALSAYFIGYIMEIISGRWFAFWMGILLVLLVVPTLWWKHKTAEA